MNLYTQSKQEIIQHFSNVLTANGTEEAWRNRALAMMRALTGAMVELRENHNIMLNKKMIMQYSQLDQMVDLENDLRISENSRTDIKRYLDALPGFRSGDKNAYMLHGYLNMQWDSVLENIENGK